MARESWETGKLDFIGVRQETSEDWAWECVCMWLRRGNGNGNGMPGGGGSACNKYKDLQSGKLWVVFSFFFSLARIASSLRTQHCGQMLLAHMHCKKWVHHLRAKTRQGLQYILKIWNIYSYIYTLYLSYKAP